MDRVMAIALITTLMDHFPNYPMKRENYEAWAKGLEVFECTPKTRADVTLFARKWEGSHPPGIGQLRSIIRQSNEAERGRKELPELPRTKEEETVCEREMAKIWKILGGKKKAFEPERDVSGPIQWNRQQCGNPACLDFHAPEDCPLNAGDGSAPEGLG